MELIVRNEEEAWTAFCLAVNGCDIAALRFDGWPSLTVSTSGAIDAVRESRAILKMQEVVERSFALLKYGRLDRKYLKDRDIAEVRINVSRVDGDRKLVFDFSAAANAAARIISRRYASGQLDITEGDAKVQEESWPRTVREVAGKVVDKVTRRKAAGLGFAAILVGAISWASPTM